MKQKRLKIVRRSVLGPDTLVEPVNIVMPKTLDLRNQKAIQGVLAGKSKAEALRDAGFSESVAKMPQKVFDKPEVKQVVNDYVSRLERARDHLMRHLEAKVIIPEKEGEVGVKQGQIMLDPEEISKTMNNLTKDIQLISGKATQNINVNVQVEHRNKVHDIIFDNTEEENE